MEKYLKNNLKDIRKYYLKNVKTGSKGNSQSIKNEFKEWAENSFNGQDLIWTLPDLTRKERLENFYRSIKKKKS